MKISNSSENTIAKILIGAILVTPACAMIKVSPQPKTEYVQPKNKGSEFEKVVATFKTPEDLEAYVLKNFTYEEDLGANERLLSEERMLEKRKGDCEDYSLFISKALRAMGYDVRVLGVKFNSKYVGGKEAGHAIAIYFDPAKGGWRGMNGYDYAGEESEIPKTFRNPDEIAMYIFDKGGGIGKPTFIKIVTPEELVEGFRKMGRYIP